MLEETDLKSTMTGRPAIRLEDAEIAVYLYTARSVYALDADGVCRFVCDADMRASDGSDAPPVSGISPVGEAALGDRPSAPSKVDRCVGAQYAAALDLQSEQGLVPDPQVGCHALFIGRGTGMRMALIKTPPLTRVVFAEDEEPVEAEADQSGDGVGWEQEAGDKSWLRSTKVGHPAMVDAALDALRRSGKSSSLPWLQES